MRIGILTFHRSINNGAVMQCYSLSKYLQQQFPQDKVEVVDYHMPKVASSYEVSVKSYFRGTRSLKSLIWKTAKLVLNPDMFVWKRDRIAAFEKVRHILPLSKESILDDGTVQLFDYINNHYDVVIAGSDAIWNYVMRGFPNPYFLDEKIKCQKLSYAASCYGMSYEKIPDEQRTKIRQILDSYRFLGVRDDESANFVMDIGCSSNSVHTCDPTVFLDVEDLPIDEEELKAKLRKKGFDFDRETIGIMGSERMCSMVRSMYGKKYQIVALYEKCRNADVNLYDLTPYEWAYVFRLFKVTFTTYFHGTMLSLRNGTPVICVALETEYSKNHMTKVEDFLRRIDWQDCYFHTDYKGENQEQIKSKADQLLNDDYHDVIIERMNTEAQSVEVFLQELHTIKADLDRKDNQND